MGRPKKNATPVSADSLESPGAEMADEMVGVVPLTHGFILTDDEGIQHKYSVGVNSMLREHAEHWYSVANGVTITE